METQNTYSTNEGLNTSNKFNGTTVVADTEGKITRDELKTYAITLGEKFAYDIYNINEKDPILYWEAEYPIKAKLNINQTYIKAGEKLQLNVVGTPFAGMQEGNDTTVSVLENLQNTDYTWISSNEDIAKVDGNGEVTGLKDGYTTIYATYKYEDEEGNEKTILAECIINVASNIAVPQTETGNGFTVVLKADGTLWVVGAGPVSAQGTDVKPTQIKINENTNLENIVKISAGTNEIIALNKFGEIYIYNINEPYATKNETLTNIVDISAGDNILVGLDKNGNVYKWNKETEAEKQNLENIIRISVGNGNIGALESNGVLWSFGENGKGQLGLNSKTNLEYPLAVTTNVTEVSNGGVHAVIQKTDKKLYATGDMYQTGTFEEIALPETVTDLNPVKYFKTGYGWPSDIIKDSEWRKLWKRQWKKSWLYRKREGLYTPVPRFTEGWPIHGTSVIWGWN